MGKIFNKEQGITLVALVVTIIILLILSGVAITALTQTGLFENARQAKNVTENAQNTENTVIANYENKVSEIVSGATRDNQSEEVKQQKTMSETEHFTGEYYLDGKPIYSKTINCGNYPNKAQISVPHNVSNYDKMWIDMSNSYVMQSTYIIPCVYLNNIGYGIGTFIRGNNIILSASDNRTDCIGIITIKYTKTTD